MNTRPKIIRITTVAPTMNIILKGQLSFMSKFYEMIGITSKDEKHFPEIGPREGARMIELQFSRMISPFQDLRSLFALFLVLLQEKPQIVHTHTPKAGLIGMLASYFAGVPTRIHTVGGIPWMESVGLKRYILKKMEKITYRLAHRVYPNSKGLYQFILTEKLCSDNKLKVLANGSSNGINTDFFASDTKVRSKMREHFNIANDEIILGFIGRLAREKGICEILQAYDLIKMNFNVKLLFIGLFEKINGRLPEVVESRIQTDPGIIFPGRADDVRPFYNMMDIFIFPSYREGFPNAVMEASSMGLPVIASDINGCNEIIHHQINGLLVNPKSVESLYKALEVLLLNPELRYQYGKNGRELVIQNFKRENVWSALKAEYDYFLDKSNNPFQKTICQ